MLLEHSEEDLLREHAHHGRRSLAGARSTKAQHVLNRSYKLQLLFVQVDFGLRQHVENFSHLIRRPLIIQLTGNGSVHFSAICGIFQCSFILFGVAQGGFVVSDELLHLVIIEFPNLDIQILMI